MYCNKSDLAILEIQCSLSSDDCVANVTSYSIDKFEYFVNIYSF